ncbi:MAG: hypothetical protein ACTSR8_07140 [Promethearchaeota archaeon]
MVQNIETDSPYKSLSKRANDLLRETKLLQISKSANILIDIFGLQKSFSKIKPKKVGKQVEMYFPALNGSLTYTLVDKQENFKCIFGKPENPVATITMNVKDEKVLKLISDIVKLKRNIFGLMRIAPKVLTRKLKIKGSWISALNLCQLMMIGQHEVYKGQL